MPTIAGKVARIEWSYFVAAGIDGYAITRDPERRTWSATVTIVDPDAFKLSRREPPLFLVVPHKGGSWRFQIRGPIPRVAGTCSLQLDAPFEIGRTHVTTNPQT